MTVTTGKARWWPGRKAPSRRFEPTVRREPWANGPLLPLGWRPDREGPAEDDDDRRRVVVDRAGQLRRVDGTDSAHSDVAALVAGACPGIADARAGF